jgi:hypothetical protein
MEPLVVRRSAWGMWAMALGGVPLIVVAVDVLTRRRIVDAVRELLFRPEDTQLLEPRDVIWAWALLVVGLVFTIWGVKELIAPAVVVRADSSGVAVRLRGPLRPPVLLPWEVIDDVGSGTVDDEGEALPVLWLRLESPEGVPHDPWGARWVDGRTVALLAADWEQNPTEVAAAITEQALAAAERETPPPDERPAGVPTAGA